MNKYPIQRKQMFNFLLIIELLMHIGIFYVSRCSYFRALLLDDFHEKTQNKPIELTDIDYQTFIELLFFIYTGSYNPTLSYDLALKCLIYSNKINFSSGKDAAIEKNMFLSTF